MTAKYIGRKHEKRKKKKYYLYLLFIIISGKPPPPVCGLVDWDAEESDHEPTGAILPGESQNRSHDLRHICSIHDGMYT